MHTCVVCGKAIEHQDDLEWHNKLPMHLDCKDLCLLAAAIRKKENTSDPVYVKQRMKELWSDRYTYIGQAQI